MTPTPTTPLERAGEIEKVDSILRWACDQVGPEAPGISACIAAHDALTHLSDALAAKAFATPPAVDQALDALAAAPSPSSGLDEMLGKIAANNIHDEIENGD